MKKVIEADFFPPGPDLEFSWSGSIGRSAVEEKQRILIVDNSCDFTHATKLALEKTGRYLIYEENDATKAHRTAQSLKPDLILLDIAMLQMDSGNVAARIESDPELQKTPIIFLTALVTKAEAGSGLEIQGHPFLAKPISIPDLIAGIEGYPPARATF